MAEQSDERPNGVVFSTDGGVYFVPDDQLENFRVPDESAARLDDAFGDEVEGFGRRPRMEQPRLKQMSWGFAGPIRLSNTGTSNETHLELTIPPKR